jgi:hypothetical protein
MSFKRTDYEVRCAFRNPAKIRIISIEAGSPKSPQRTLLPARKRDFQIPILPWLLPWQVLLRGRRSWKNSINQKFPLDTLVQNYSLSAIRAAIQLRANNPAALACRLCPS